MNKKKRISIIFVLMLFLFSVFKITEALTSESFLQITNVEILNKSDTVEIIDVDFSKNTVQPKIIHHKIGDTITYKIHIKNKENKNYTIKSIKDNNTNEYISYEYENYEGFKINPQEEFSINIKETYYQEITDISKRNQIFSIIFTIILEDENNNIEEQQINFNDSARLRTGEYLNLYVVSAVLSFVMLLIFLIKRKSYHYKYEKISLLKNLVKKYITLFSLVFLATLNIVPIISNDIDLESFDFAFQSSINLNDKLIVSCEIDGTTTDLVVDYNKRVELPPDPQKTGYNFNKWVLEDGTEFDVNTPITKDIKLKADFIPTKYYISYELNGGTLPANYPTQYDIETENFILKNPTQKGYEFTGWTGSNGDVPQTEVTIQKGSTEDKTYTAHWNKITYNITYNLDGGTLPDGYPTSYTIESETFTLNNPTKDYYNFTGWTEENGPQVPQITVTIPKGSTGNKNYTAHWEPITYNITYDLDGGTLPTGYPTSYNVETETFTLNNPTKEGYTFTGWTGSNGDQPQTEVTIQKGSTGNREYTANWELITYTITYDLDGGTADPANPTSYTIESEIITLNKPTKEGLRFKGWTGSNGETPQPTVTIPQGSTGDKTYTANWTDEYTIIFHSNNGQDQTNTQTVKFDQEYQLNENTFTNGDMEFKEWTTNPDGSGIKYINKRVKYNSSRTSMVTVPFKIVNLPVNEDLEIHLYAQWQEPNLTKTTFDKGQNVNVKMKQLAGNSSATYNSTDENIHFIKKATQEQLDSATANKVNVASSYYENYYDKPIYMWFDNGTIYYYSEADIIYLNETNSYLFNGLTELISVDLSGVDSSIVKNMESMFGQCKKLETLDLRNFNTSAVNSMQYMINECESLISLDVSSFNTCQVNTMRNMFSSCKELETLNITNFNTFNVKYMNYMFYNMDKIETLDLSSFDTSNVTNMSKMFNGCQSLKRLDLSSFDTSNVTTMSQMFSNCTSLESLNLSGFSYESITNNNIIQFRNLTALKELNLTNFNAGNVTNMSQMFYNLTNLEELNLTNFKTTSATNMASMFAQCTKLKKLDLSSFDTSNVTLMNSMFNNCASLISLDVSSFNTSLVTDMNRMFASCEALDSLDVSSFDTSSVTNMEKMFSNMKNIETIYASDNFVTTSVTNGNLMFVYDTTQPGLDAPSKLKGGQGTTYNKNHLGKDYACIDDPDNGSPGYFTRKN